MDLLVPSEESCEDTTVSVVILKQITKRCYLFYSRSSTSIVTVFLCNIVKFCSISIVSLFHIFANIH